jgi:hypothetical protein
VFDHVSFPSKFARTCDFNARSILTRTVIRAYMQQRRGRLNRIGRRNPEIGVSGGRGARAAVLATPAHSPLHECSPCEHVHVRCERLGFVPRSRSLFCRTVPNPGRVVPIRNVHCMGMGVQVLDTAVVARHGEELRYLAHQGWAALADVQVSATLTTLQTS